MTTPVDLHALANIKGAGVAYRKLLEAGHIDNHAGTGEPREFLMQVYASVYVSCIIRVTARNEDEACEIAENKAENGEFAWSDFYDAVDIEVSVVAE